MIKNWTSVQTEPVIDVYKNYIYYNGDKRIPPNTISKVLFRLSETANLINIDEDCKTDQCQYHQDNSPFHEIYICIL